MASLKGAYEWAVDACNNDKIQYSQSYRNFQTRNGITYCDCSSFINRALGEGGFKGITDGTTKYFPDTNYYFTTKCEKACLESIGWVEKSGNKIRRGDIGLNIGTHTEMCYKKGTKTKGAQFMGAHSATYSAARQVSINNYTSTFNHIYKCPSSDDDLHSEGTIDDIEDDTQVSDYVIAAMCGNAWQESHCDPAMHQIGTPDSYNDPKSAAGLFMWSNEGDKNGRCYQMHNYLKNLNLADYNLPAQCDYVVYENDWIDNGYGYANLQEFLASTSTSIDDLTDAFCACWERAGVSALEERRAFAREAYDYIEQEKERTTGFWHYNFYYDSDCRTKALENSLWIYRSFHNYSTNTRNSDVDSANNGEPQNSMNKEITTADDFTLAPQILTFAEIMENLGSALLSGNNGIKPITIKRK